MSETWLLIESSGRTARLGVVRAGLIVARRELTETRRLARDLAPTIGELLRETNLQPKLVDGVMVSIGPGSYTGLRVGIMAAKAFAYATGCKLIAVPTFAAIALEAPAEAEEIWVVGDALQGLIYLQRFLSGTPSDDLRIVAAAEVLPALHPTRVFGPGLAVHAPESARVILEPSLESLFRSGQRLAPLSREALFALEPLYLRGSSAEEKAKANEPRG